MNELPDTWSQVPISEVAEINPRKSVDLNGDDLVSFVPMAAVDEVSGTIAAPIDRPYSEVSKGFTHFRDEDVIFAKITPSMENGKSAVARDLTNGTGMGSTEFHVFRSYGAIEPEYLWRYIRQQSFRDDAQTVMSGAVGQQRVPAEWLKEYMIPLAPKAEQGRIVKKVDSLTTRTARALKELDHVPDLIARYKRSLLGNMFERLAAEHGTQPLAELTTKIGSGATPRGGSSVYVEQGTPFIRSQNVYFEGFEYEGLAFIDDAAAKALSNVTTEENDVLLNITGASIGRATILPDELAGGRVNQHVSILRCKPNLLNLFLLYFLWSPEMQKLINDENYGVTRQALTKSMIEGFLVPLPPLEEQAKIVRRIESAFDWIDSVANEHASATKLLPKLDGAILAKAFQGKLVPQDPNDEPASALLERVKKARVAEPKVMRGKGANNSKSRKETQTMTKNLEEVLSEAGDWISAQEAFAQCGIGGSATTEEIEKIYAQLRKLDKADRLEAEPIHDEQGRKLHDRLRLKAA